jgi:hypothetical protein
MGYQGTRKEKILSKLYLQQYSFTSIQSLRKFTLGGVCKFVRIVLRIVFKAGDFYLMRILFPRSPNRTKGSSFPASKSARMASKAGALVNRIYSSGKPSTVGSRILNGAKELKAYPTKDRANALEDNGQGSLK